MASVNMLNEAAFSVSLVDLTRQTQSTQASSSSSVSFKDTVNQAVEANKASESGARAEATGVKEQTAQRDDTVRKALKESTKEADVKVEEATTSVSETVSEIKDIIKKLLGISDEELESLMAELGFVQMDLLEVQNITKLILTDGEINPLASEDFAKTLTDLRAVLDELKGELKELGILTENADFKEMLMDAGITEDMLSTPAESVQLNTEAITFTTESNVTNEVAEVNPEAGKVAADKKEPVLTERDKTASAEEVTTENQNSEVKLSVESDKEMSKDFSKGDSRRDYGSASNPEVFSAKDVVSEFVGKVNEILNENEIAEPSRVLEQIINEIKVQIKQDTSSIEMQLYPQHLGKVGIEVVSKEGGLTANITVNDEQVKEIIQSNLEVLKENLSNQGLEIKDIDVTVRSRSFDDTLNEDNGKQSEQEKGKRAFRDTDSFGEEAGQMELEDMIGIMMQGSTMSLMA